MFSVKLSNKAEKQTLKLEPSIRSRVDELFTILESKPIPTADYDLKKIKGEENTYRIRLSSYRVLYKLFWDEKIIRVIKVEKRSDNTY
ncbi:MAG: type II toxin-antitoxin system RelE/ParE family toxin [Candidatus Marsarchaeota archaeon]|nr:type II toxin-antitoxin system RelE/ParE family toxin [Candidatus Marsarchaeota archaeon]